MQHPLLHPVSMSISPSIHIIAPPSPTTFWFSWRFTSTWAKQGRCMILLSPNKGLVLGSIALSRTCNIGRSMALKSAFCTDMANCSALEQRETNQVERWRGREQCATSERIHGERAGTVPVFIYHWEDADDSKYSLQDHHRASPLQLCFSFQFLHGPMKLCVEVKFFRHSLPNPKWPYLYTMASDEFSTTLFFFFVFLTSISHRSLLVVPSRVLRQLLK